jgi:hypothetical protein
MFLSIAQLGNRRCVFSYSCSDGGTKDDTLRLCTGEYSNYKHEVGDLQLANTIWEAGPMT